MGGVHCEICNKKFRTRYNLQIHMAVHTGERPHVCQVCKKGYQQKWNLLTHISRVHEQQKPFMCNECGRHFGYVSHFKTHMKSHFVEKLDVQDEVKQKILLPHQCCYCSRRFECERLKLEHERIHTGIAMFMCDSCGRKFRTKALIRSHVRRPCRNSGANRLEKTSRTPCELCGKLIARYSMNKHMNIHTRKRVYACRTCGKEFLESGQRSVHERTHSGAKPYQCEVCQKGHAQLGNLLAHRKRLHGLSERPEINFLSSEAIQKNVNCTTRLANSSPLSFLRSLVTTRDIRSDNEQIEEYRPSLLTQDDLKISKNAAEVAETISDAELQSPRSDDIGNTNLSRPDDLLLSTTSTVNTNHLFSLFATETRQTISASQDGLNEDTIIQASSGISQTDSSESSSGDNSNSLSSSDESTSAMNRTDSEEENFALMQPEGQSSTLVEFENLTKSTQEPSSKSSAKSESDTEDTSNSEDEERQEEEKVEEESNEFESIRVHPEENNCGSDTIKEFLVKYSHWKRAKGTHESTTSNNERSRASELDNSNTKGDVATINTADEIYDRFMNEVGLNVNVKQALAKIQQTGKGNIFIRLIRQLKEAIPNNSVVNMRSDDKLDWTCWDCPAKFKSKSLLSRHRTTHLDPHNRPFCCHICSRTFTQSGNLQHHLLVHNDEHKFFCEVCGARFRHKSHFTEHRNRHNHSYESTNKFQCPQCSKCCSSSFHLSEHIRTHTNDRPYLCKVCGVQFAAHSSFTRHSRIHDGVKVKVQCSICGASFSDKSSCKRHEKAHFHKQAHNCVCGRTFAQKENLIRHSSKCEKSENFETKLVQCGQCQKYFMDDTALKRHSKSHENSRRFDCNLCKLSLKTKETLARHVRRHNTVEQRSVD